MPALSRISTDLSPLPLLELRAEAYLALTTNTLQFGARIELVAEVAKCGLHGHLALDVLLQYEPVHFIADVSMGVALRVIGQDLVGVALDFRLEGPARWHARGRGSIDLFLFSTSFDFDKEWGSDPPSARPALDVGLTLQRALEDPGAWVVHRAATRPAGLTLTADADRRLGAGELVDPYGSLTVRQKLVPLALTIDRMDRIPLPAPERWDIVGGQLGGKPAPSGAEVREAFPAGQFLSLTDDEQLSRPAYESFRAGLDLTGNEVKAAPPVEHLLDFETKVFVDETSDQDPITFALELTPDLLAAAAAAADVDHPLWWPDVGRSLTVAAEVPLAAASAWSLTSVAVEASGASDAELREALAADPRPDLMVVEAWEMAG